MFLVHENKGGLCLTMGVAQFLKGITCFIYTLIFSRRYLNTILDLIFCSVSSVYGGPHMVQDTVCWAGQGSCILLLIFKKPYFLKVWR